MSKIFDCITFFDNNFMFEIRYNILLKYVHKFIVCESAYDHSGKKKKKNFIWKSYYKKDKIKHIFMKDAFPKKNSRWENQALQREYLLDNLNFVSPEDYIFFSDPDEIMSPKKLKRFQLKKKYGIFFQDCFNYKFNLYNPHESPWEGSRVAKKKDLKSIDFMRQKVKSKNIKKFYRPDIEKSIQIFKNAGWHFNNIMNASQISLKLKTFAHKEFSSKKYSSIKIIEQNIKERKDLFGRGHTFKRIDLSNNFPEFLLKNKKRYKKFIV
jgi:beta-1,4-mannosyl-glycoprotein beta-1,4-N-acetylglucosaminyltransferase